MKTLPCFSPFRAAALLALVAAATFAGGCSKSSTPAAASGAPDDEIKIGFLVKQPDSSWFQYEWKFAEQAAKANGFTLIKIGATDGEKVLTAIDSLASAGAQGFVICTPDTRLGSAIVAKARAANLKVMAVDDQLLGPDGKPIADVPYLGISAKKIGEDVGTLLVQEMKRRGWTPAEAAVLMVTQDELATTKERTDGSERMLIAGGFPAERIYRAPVRTTDVPGAMDATNTLLSQHPDVKHWLVCGFNDNAVLGAVRALEGRGFPAESCVGIGIDGVDCIPEFEKAKPTSFYGSMLLRTRVHGYKTAEMMYKWIKDGVKPPLDTRTDAVLITRENYERVLKEQGFRD